MVKINVEYDIDVDLSCYDDLDDDDTRGQIVEDVLEATKKTIEEEDLTISINF